jgi:MoxR-like ATPase
VDQIKIILDTMNRVIIGKEDALNHILAGIFCGGHLLIEDVPGTGKTTLAKALARVLGCTFNRIQFTPDLMPSDVIGLSIYDRDKEAFVFQPGPIISQFVLADEINRTSPKTQAALLEAMAEKQVTVDGVTYPLPKPFIVIATQNPVEYEGTYPLPEAQLDRFMLRVRLGYPEPEHEEQIIKLDPDRAIPAWIDEIINPEMLLALKEQADKIFMAEVLEDYLIRLISQTRVHPDLLLGISPRGGQHLYRVARALALVKERNYVLPDDIKEIAPAVFEHRLIVRPEARLKGKTVELIVQEILLKTHVPVYVDDRVQ